MCCVMRVELRLPGGGVRLCDGAEGGRTEEEEAGAARGRPHTRLYSLRLSCRMVSLTAANTKRMFSVSVAHVKCE